MVTMVAEHYAPLRPVLLMVPLKVPYEFLAQGAASPPHVLGPHGLYVFAAVCRALHD
jgi:hypothetical protein